ncbi:MAG: hypothetical protein IPJ74_27505, partial [Saprospiraceae bacterium]|nr:hypothetical protein [Saprospiraceae bacterium]
MIDNANELKDLLECQQRLRSLRATTLITSRAQPEDWSIIKIEELSHKDAYLLFTTHYRVGIAVEQMDLVYELLERLNHHTLLVELIAKAADKANLSITELNELVQKNYLHDEKLNERQIATGAHADHTKLPQQARVENYIQMVFKEMPKLSDAEQRYLRYMTLLPSNEYSESELETYFQIATDAKSEFLDTLESLTSKGWLTQ